MIDAEQSTGHFYTNLAGSENDLNHVLSTFVDYEHEITIFFVTRGMLIYLKLNRYSKIAQTNS